MHPPDDERQRRDLLRHSEDAYRSAVTNQYKSVFRQLRTLCNATDLAADLTQETFIEAWKSLRTLRRHQSLSAWLRTVAARVWWRHLKAQKPVSLLIDDLAEILPAPEIELEAALLNHLEWEVVACAIDKLPPLQRTLVVLRHIEQMPLAEIASALDLPLGTVKSRLHDAMNRLRRNLSYLQEEI